VVRLPNVAAGQQRRARRSGDEVRELLLRAARELFATEGFAGATTKAIARRADVTEATLFRIFASKERLFEAAVLGPFEDFLGSFTDAWLQAAVPGGTPEEVLPQFVRGVYALVRANRDLFAAMTSTNVLGTRARPALDRLEELGVVIASTQRLPFDPRVAVRIATAAVVSIALVRDDLFAPDSGIDDERILAEMVRMLIGAARYAPPDA
jgi:AcrR family transcriptional regulator